jgi:hypothetical protein
MLEPIPIGKIPCALYKFGGGRCKAVVQDRSGKDLLIYPLLRAIFLATEKKK